MAPLSHETEWQLAPVSSSLVTHITTVIALQDPDIRYAMLSALRDMVDRYPAAYETATRMLDELQIAA